MLTPSCLRSGAPRLPVAAGLALLFLASAAAQTDTWTSIDVGAVGIAGNAAESGGVVTVRGSGGDIWGAADGFHFRTQSLTGDGAIVARVTSTGGGHAWAKVGLMMRELNTPGARNVMILLTPGGSLGMQVRATAGGSTTYAEQARAGAPQWLMLDRQGDVFRAYRSTDGDHWLSAGTATLALPPTIQLGLAVTSHNNSALQTATFDTVMRLGESPSSGQPNPPGDFRAHSPHGGAVQLNWSDASTDETGFQIERAPAGGAFSVLTTVPADTTVFVDNPPNAFSYYSYQMRTVRAGAYSPYTPTLTLRPELAPLPSGWFSTDVGNTGSAGYDSGHPEPGYGSAGIVTVNAGGTDIFGTADGFRYYTQTSSGDSTVVSRVVSLTNTHPWAKAGVMFRASLSPGSANVAMLITPTSGCTFQVRPVAGATTSHDGGGNFPAPAWVKLTRIGNTFTGFVSADGSTWTEVGSQTVNLPVEAYAGFCVSAHSISQASASFDHIEVNRGAASSNWGQLNFGSAAGSVDPATTITVTAGSGDIYGNRDSGVYYYRTWTGDGEFKVKAGSLTRSHDWAKAGIMLRATALDSAGNAFVAVTATQGAVFQSRVDWGWNTVTHARQWNAGPGSWLRLVRSGGSLAASWSADGTTWQSLGTASDTLPPTIYVGVAASSHDPGAATTATFTAFTAQ